MKRVIHRCMRCVQWRAATPTPQMGNLPQERVAPARLFLNTGVDYAGPVQLRTLKGRGHRSYKAFVAVFMCLPTRAGHPLKGGVGLHHVSLPGSPAAICLMPLDSAAQSSVTAIQIFQAPTTSCGISSPKMVPSSEKSSGGWLGTALNGDSARRLLHTSAAFGRPPSNR